MSRYSAASLIVGLISAVLGFRYFGGTAATIAQWCFVAFLIISLVPYWINRRPRIDLKS